MAILNNIITPYPDFVLDEVVDPEQFDANDAEIQTKLNLFIDQININKQDALNIETDKIDDADIVSKLEIDTIDSNLTLKYIANDADILDLQNDKADDNAVVHNTLNENVGGVKTFISSPLSTQPVNDNQPSNKEYVDLSTLNALNGVIPNDSVEEIKQHPSVKTGQLADLDTINKTSLVGAISEVNDNKALLQSNFDLIKDSFDDGSILKGTINEFITAKSITVDIDGTDYYKLETRDANGVLLATSEALTKSSIYTDVGFMGNRLYFSVWQPSGSDLLIREFNPLTMEIINSSIVNTGNGQIQGISGFESGRLFLLARPVDLNSHRIVELNPNTLAIIGDTEVSSRSYSSFAIVGDRMFLSDYNSPILYLAELNTITFIITNSNTTSELSTGFVHLLNNADNKLVAQGGLVMKEVDMDLLFAIEPPIEPSLGGAKGSTRVYDLNIDQVEVNGNTYALTIPITAD